MKKNLVRILIVLFVIIVIVFVGFFAGYLYIKSKFDKMTYKPLDETDLGIKPEIIEKAEAVDDTIKFVIFGSDSRETNNQYAGRSDTIIIVVINNTKKSINLISIPRDTYVSVPNYGLTKINHAYAYGQEQLSIKTINSNFNLDLTQYMTIDFSGLVDSINLVGGVEVTLGQEEVNFINGHYRSAYIPGPGKVTLNGEQALIHSRNRYVGNDFVRASRQRAILVSLLNKIMDKDVNEILSLSDQILVNITTNMDMNKYKEMFTEVASERKEYLKNINSVQIPSTEYGNGSMIDGIYYFTFDMNRADEDFKKYYFGK